jgi:hypothetical protein
MKLVRLSILSFWMIFNFSLNDTIANYKTFYPILPSELQIVNKESTPDSVVNIKQIGLEILNGFSISQINEKYIYQLMDSIMVLDSIERSFYFEVFNKIYEQATGYIYYEIGFSIKEYLRQFPDDFFSLPDSRLKEYAFEIGELFRTEEEFPLEAAKKYASELEERCSAKYLKKLEKFNKEMLEAVESKK